MHNKSESVRKSSEVPILNVGRLEELTWKNHVAFTRFQDIAHVEPIGSPVICKCDDDDIDYYIDFVIHNRPKVADAYSVGNSLYNEKTKDYYLPIQYYKIRRIEGS